MGVHRTAPPPDLGQKPYKASFHVRLKAGLRDVCYGARDLLREIYPGSSAGNGFCFG